MPLEAPDFLQDVIDRLTVALVATAPQTPERFAAIKTVEREIRRDYGRDRITISTGKSERNAQIQRDYLNNASMPTLIRRYELTERQIIRIVKAATDV